MSSESGIYSQHKALFHRDRMLALMAGKCPAPVHVQLIPTNRCNHNCQWCAYRQPDYSSNETFADRDEIPLAKLAEIVSDCKHLGVKSIEVTGGGEPSVHKDFACLLHMIVDAGMDLGLVTNGSLLDRNAMSALMSATWVRISIDAGTNDTYAKTRQVPQVTLSRVRGHVASLADSRQAASPVVGVGFVLTEHNWREVALATKHAYEDGADNIRIGAMFSNYGTGYFNAVKPHAMELLAEARSMATDSFEVHDLVTDRINQLDGGAPLFHDCWHQRLSTLIGADQNVYRCCVVAYNHVGLIGSIRHSSFADLWNSPETHRDFAEFDATQCPRCIRPASNAAIAGCINSGFIPTVECQHANFI